MTTPLSDTHFIDMLYLELSLVTNAKTGKEIKLEADNIRLKEIIERARLQISYMPNAAVAAERLVADVTDMWKILNEADKTQK